MVSSRTKRKRRKHRKRPETACIYIRNVERLLHDNFKAACVRRGRTMTEEILQFMETYVERDGISVSDGEDEDDDL